MSFELLFAQQHADNLFSAKLEYGRIRNLRANISEWCYSPWIELQLPARKVKNMLAELLDHATALPNQSIINKDIAWCT